MRTRIDDAISRLNSANAITADCIEMFSLGGAFGSAMSEETRIMIDRWTAQIDANVRFIRYLELQLTKLPPDETQRVV